MGCRYITIAMRKSKDEYEEETGHGRRELSNGSENTMVFTFSFDRRSPVHQYMLLRCKCTRLATGRWCCGGASMIRNKRRETAWKRAMKHSTDPAKVVDGCTFSAAKRSAVATNKYILFWSGNDNGLDHQTYPNLSTISVGMLDGDTLDCASPGNGMMV